MEQLKKQLDDHNTGVKNFDERRLKSLKNRLQSYKGQIYDATRTLSPEVCHSFTISHETLVSFVVFIISDSTLSYSDLRDIFSHLGNRGNDRWE